MVQHRECQPGEGVSLVPSGNRQGWGGGVKGRFFQNVPQVIRLGRWGSEHELLEREFKFGSEDNLPAFGDEIGVSVMGRNWRALGNPSPPPFTLGRWITEHCET